MATFLRLTERDTGGALHVNFDHVERFYAYDRGGTRLVLADDFILVREDYEEVVAAVERNFAFEA